MTAKRQRTILAEVETNIFAHILTIFAITRISSNLRFWCRHSEYEQTICDQRMSTGEQCMSLYVYLVFWVWLATRVCFVQVAILLFKSSATILGLVIWIIEPHLLLTNYQHAYTEETNTKLYFFDWIGVNMVATILTSSSIKNVVHWSCHYCICHHISKP